jgi:hypothetical protein
LFSDETDPCFGDDRKSIRKAEVYRRIDETERNLNSSFGGRGHTSAVPGPSGQMQAAASVHVPCLVLHIERHLAHLIDDSRRTLHLLRDPLEISGWFKKGSGAVAGTARRVLRTTVPDPFLNHAGIQGGRLRGKTLSNPTPDGTDDNRPLG